MGVVGSVLYKTLLYVSMIFVAGVFILLVIAAGQSLAYPLDLECIKIQGKSMEPMLHAGTRYAFDTDFQFDEIKLGSIVVFHDTNYFITDLVAHEVVGMNGGILITRGIANEISDEPISYWQVKGIYAGKPCST